VQAVADAPSRLTLDTRDLTIHSVQLAGGDGSTPQPLQHSFGDRHEVRGWLAGCRLGRRRLQTHTLPVRRTGRLLQLTHAALRCAPAA
jgi:hypothetical protein